MKFQVYQKEYYDRIFAEIMQINRSWSPKKISQFINKRISLTSLFGQMLSEEASKHFPIYRARAIDLDKGDTIDESRISSFGYPPKRAIKTHGRANRKGQQVFYASGDPHTTIHEIADDIKLNSTIVYISKWGLKKYPGQVLIRNLFFGIPIDTENYASIMAGGLAEKFDEMFANVPSEIKELYRYGQQKYADLFTSPGKDLYHVTSSIIYDTFVDAKKQGVSFPIVTYPSVARHRESVNFVFRKDFVDSYFYLQHVYKVLVTELTEDVVNTTLLSIGASVNGAMRWVTPKSSLNEIDYSQAIVYTERTPGGRKLLEDEAITTCCENHKVPMNEFLDKNKVNAAAIVDKIKAIPLNATMDSLPLDFTTTLTTETFGTVYIHNKIVDEGRISKIELPIKCTITYN